MKQTQTDRALTNIFQEALTPEGRLADALWDDFTSQRAKWLKAWAAYQAAMFLVAKRVNSAIAQSQRPMQWLLARLQSERGKP